MPPEPRAAGAVVTWPRPRQPPPAAGRPASTTPAASAFHLFTDTFLLVTRVSFEEFQRTAGSAPPPDVHTPKWVVAISAVLPGSARRLSHRPFGREIHVRTTCLFPRAAQPRTPALKSRQPRGERYADLKSITQPTLVVNTSHDIMCPTINSYLLAQHIPSAELIIYPDSGHAALFQYAPLFVSQVAQFLDSAVPFQVS